MLKVCVIYGGPSNADWMAPLGIRSVETIEEADIVLFTGGGADVGPYLYGEKTGRHTHVDKNRDSKEVAAFKHAKKLNKLMVGHCRGAQLLCVMAGGKLIQDVNHHAGPSHVCTSHDNDTYPMNTVHHQMQFPFDLPKEDYTILSWTLGISDTYTDGDNQEITLPEGFVEPEAVRYHKIRALGFQGHPEWMRPGKGLEKCKEFLKTFLEEELQIEITEMPVNDEEYVKDN